MCLIIKTDTPKQLNLELLRTAYSNNSDGFGVMFCNKGKLHTQKIVPKNFKDIENLWSKYNNLDTPMGLHFRFNTNGDTTRSMSHPFQILSKAKGDDRDIWVMHNGPQLPTPMIDDNKSDTHQFIKWVLRPQLSANPRLLYNAEWQEMIEDLIGTDKLLFLDGKTKEFVIYNESEGKEMDNIGWLSNTYSIQPTGFGVRNYTYDFKSNKMGWKSPSWWDDDDSHYSGVYGANYNNIYNQKAIAHKTNEEEKGKIDLSKYTATTHYNNRGQETHTTYTPIDRNNGSEFTSSTYGIKNEIENNLKGITENSDTMYNGKNLEWQDVCYLDKDELEELCEENPKGIAHYIYDLVLGGIHDK